MKPISARSGVVGAGLAVVLTMAGAAAVQAQEPATKGSAPSAVPAARVAVAQHSARFGFGPGQTLSVKAVYRDAGGSAVRFARTYRGLPVVDGDFIVHLDAAGHYRYAEGIRVSGLPAGTTPALDATVAVAAAAKAVGYVPVAPGTRLAVLGTAHGSPLVWQVSTRDHSGKQGDVTYVSASSGRALASWPTIQNDDGTGQTLYSGTVALKDRKKNSHRYKLIDNTRGKQRIYDAHNQEITAGTLFKDSNNVWGTGSNTSRETAGADAAYGLANTWDFYLDTFGRDGIADDGVAAKAYVHVYQNYNNASWDDGCFCMRFGDGSAGAGWGPLVSLDVGGHEMTHGVTSRTAGLNYFGESGGLNESTSDVMGTMVEWYANNPNDVPDYMIGEEFYLNYDPETHFLRRMDQPSLDGGSADCWYNGVGNLDVHYSSGVGNHVFYLLSEGSGSKTINGLAYNSPTCDGSTVTGIGHDEAAAIWYRALTQHWVPTTDYHGARTGMLAAATELYGAGSTEYNAVNAAWKAVNVS